MTFICEPIKYKQRYRWRREDPAEHPGEYGVFDAYWEMMWVCPRSQKLGFVIVAVPEKGYFITSNLCPDDVPREHDHGPYPDLETAKAIAETYMTVGFSPDFSKPFKRPRRKREVK